MTSKSNIFYEKEQSNKERKQKKTILREKRFDGFSSDLGGTYMSLKRIKGRQKM